MGDYKMTIGLEIHAELKTNSKMFCGCKNDADEKRPNVNICPICMGHPGTLPVINREAVLKVLQVGTAINGTLADFSEFDRKNYFYPDIPKGYQISQYKYPLVSGGVLAGVAITRVHLEEDTARSSHESTTDSLVDFNRAGVPLMELVTEPVIHSAEEAMAFGRQLQLLLQYLGVSEANMEKGEMRVEVNLSVSKTDVFGLNQSEGLVGRTGKPVLGTKVEVKNINSFRAAGRAIAYEYKRQTETLDSGGTIAQETRGFDESKGTTFSQRSKENSNDYRYFPDPDLPKLQLSEMPEYTLEEIKKTLPETPTQKRVRYEKEYGLKTEDIETFVNNIEAGNFFEAVIAYGAGLTGDSLRLAANYIVSDLVGLSKVAGEDFTTGQSTAGTFTELITMIAKGDLSSRGAKDTLKIMFDSGGSPEAIAKEKGFIQKNDPDEIKKVLQDIILANPANIEEYKNGKESLLQFFVGQGMKAMKGSGNPELIKKVFLEIMNGK